MALIAGGILGVHPVAPDPAELECAPEHIGTGRLEGKYYTPDIPWCLLDLMAIELDPIAWSPALVRVSRGGIGQIEEEGARKCAPSAEPDPPARRTRGVDDAHGDPR